MIKNFLLLVFLAAVIFSGCVQVEKEKTYCEKDSDCVPEGCCHPTSCVNKEFIPECQDISCTQECKAKTMDCGCGHCACVESKCGVKWTREKEWC